MIKEGPDTEESALSLTTDIFKAATDVVVMVLIMVRIYLRNGAS
jgi:hypothetical protein